MAECNAPQVAVRIDLRQRQQALLPQRLERAHRPLVPGVPDVVAAQGKRGRAGSPGRTACERPTDWDDLRHKPPVRASFTAGPAATTTECITEWSTVAMQPLRQAIAYCPGPREHLRYRKDSSEGRVSLLSRVLETESHHTHLTCTALAGSTWAWWSRRYTRRGWWCT